MRCLKNERTGYDLLCDECRSKLTVDETKKILSGDEKVDIQIPPSGEVVEVRKCCQECTAKIVLIINGRIKELQRGMLNVLGTSAFSDYRFCEQELKELKKLIEQK